METENRNQHTYGQVFDFDPCLTFYSFDFFGLRFLGRMIEGKSRGKNDHELMATMMLLSFTACYFGVADLPCYHFKHHILPFYLVIYFISL